MTEHFAIGKPPSQSVPPPRRRWPLLSTRLKWSRNVRRFAPQITFADASTVSPSPADTGCHGEVVLLRDILVALHRDGTITRRHRTLTIPLASQNLAEWDVLVRPFDSRTTRCQHDKLICERSVSYVGGIVPTASFSDYRKFCEACARSDMADILLVHHADSGALH
jgi:hypothetical protein